VLAAFLANFLEQRTAETYYLLGKNRPGSGRLYRTSLSALIFHVMAVMNNIPRPAMMVFCLQFAGWQYQPPEGDQTCFGYLVEVRGEVWVGSWFDALTGPFCRRPGRLLANSLEKTLTEHTIFAMRSLGGLGWINDEQLWSRREVSGL
jgi:hypothetical protein